jgi:hypothetical protein
VAINGVDGGGSSYLVERRVNGCGSGFRCNMQTEASKHDTQSWCRCRAVQRWWVKRWLTITHLCGGGEFW